MNPGEPHVLLLIDLQEDFLAVSGLEPHRERVVDGARRWAEAFRARGWPVVHVRTTAGPGMLPHWRRQPPRCVPGTPGHTLAIAAEPGERVVDKTFYSGFSTPALSAALPPPGTTRLLLAGVHLHACVRATALDALAGGYTVAVAADAVASDDPIHAAATRRWLEERAVPFVTLSTGAPWTPARAEPVSGRAEVDRAVTAARASAARWNPSQVSADSDHAEGFAALLAPAIEELATMMVTDIGKPITQARAEVGRAVSLARLAAEQAQDAAWSAPGVTPATQWRRRPLGVVLALTPWNNPVAIPVGKILPALALGNTVLWKPAPPAHRVAEFLHTLMREAGFAPDRVGLLRGGAATARRAMAAGIDGVSVSGSLATGFAVAEAAARHRLALQAELGGNNAAVVLADADLALAAREIAAGAFRFSGQRCTANRRVVVAAAVREAFLHALLNETIRFEPGDPYLAATELGPMVDEEAAADFDRRVEQALAAGARELPIPWRGGRRGGAFRHPRILIARDDTGALVQEESFAPLLVVQSAADEAEAFQLCHGVRQGLSAALFSSDPAAWTRFLDQATTGIIKWNQATADAAADLPFGGWKSSGIGPPEHGPGNLRFYTRYQSVYGPP